MNLLQLPLVSALCLFWCNLQHLVQGSTTTTSTTTITRATKSATTTNAAFAFDNFFKTFKNPTRTGPTMSRNDLKTKILQLASKTNRGLTASEEQKEEMLKLFQALEKNNPIKNPLKSEKVNGNWSLDYTTSDSILGKGGFPRVGPIVQKIDTVSLRAENSEVVSYFGIRVPRKVTAKLFPRNNQLVDVQFERFSIGPIGFDAPESFKGYLDVTYLDDQVRLSRGDKGNIFVLTRME
jgi:PAP_fibrillin.